MILRQRLRQAVHRVRLVEPTAANAARLFAGYQLAYLNDETLGTCIRENLPINGMTEPATRATFQRYLEMPSTLAFEVALDGEENAIPSAFVIARYSQSTQPSKRDFRDYYLHDVFDGDRLIYSSAEDRTRLEEGFEAGNMLYLVEFVGLQGKVATTCLLLAVFHEICRKRLGCTDCQIIGKCLDAASCDGHHNSLGNAAIKRMTESFDLRKVAVGNQARILQYGGEPRSAVLRFGLYLGTSAYLSHLSASVFPDGGP